MQLDRLQWLRAAKALGWQALPPSSVVALALLVWEYLIPLGIVPGVRAQYLGTPSGVAAAAAELSDKGYGGHGLFAHVRAKSAANRHGFRRRGLHRRAAGHRVGLEQRIAAAWSTFVARAQRSDDPWLKLVRGSGAGAAEAAYRALLDGHADPR